MLNLDKLLKKTIKQFNAITIKDFLTLILYHEKLGYYRKTNIVGKEGDFITAPEISQVFGEIICNFLMVNSYSFNTKNISYVELGPGRGFLAEDILRTFKKLSSNLYNQIKNVYFLEKSETFFDNLKRVHNSVKIIDEGGKIPNGYNIILANEFFDALPINQYLFKKNNWYKVLITLDKNEKFIFSLSERPSAKKPFFPSNPSEGYVFEYSKYAINLLTSLCKQIKLFGGIFIIIDYYRNSKNKEGTLSAIKSHKKVSIFNDIGNCDISHSPDFELIKKVCKLNFCNVSGPYSQSLFLQTFGINERFKILISDNPSLKDELLFQKKRLIGEKYMGNIFKVLVVSDNKCKVL